MTIKQNHIWTKIYPKNNIIKIVSNPKQGTIKVYNEKGQIIIKKSNLTKEQIKILEENLIEHVEKKINNINKHKSKKYHYDPMIT